MAGMHTIQLSFLLVALFGTHAAMGNERFPEGISRNGYRAPGIHSGPVHGESEGEWIKSWDSPGSMLVIQSHDFRGRSFEVELRHEAIVGGDGGVVFNVETVTPALPEDRNMPTLNATEYRRGFAVGAHAAYKDDDAYKMDAYKMDDDDDYYEEDYGEQVGVARLGLDLSEIRVEQASRQPEGLVHIGGHGFLAAAMTAFARHLPLTLSPDVIWAQIAWGFAKHINSHSEELRSNFVQHEGKEVLQVRLDPTFRFGKGKSFEAAASPEDWEHYVFPDFSSQIAEHIGVGTHEAIAAPFSTTGAGARAAFEVTLMAAMKDYFESTMITTCGIPEITLTGTLEDWQRLRSRAEALGEKMVPKFRDHWMASLLPILDEFVNSYRGDVNPTFWQTMVKLRNTGNDSGSYSYISGWISVLYPYLADGNTNRFLRKWDEMYLGGVQPKDFPATISRAPVNWKYGTTTYKLHFQAGSIGFTQDSKTGSLQPVLGWAATLDPELDPASRLAIFEREIVELRKGYLNLDDNDGGWAKRVAKRHIVAMEREITILRRDLDRPPVCL